MRRRAARGRCRITCAFTAGRRLPVGASDAVVAAAERLQFVLGEGPCMTAHRTGHVVVAGGQELQDRWPLYGHQLLADTPYRGVLSLPAGGLLATWVTLDLFTTDPQQAREIPRADLAVVAGLVADALVDEMVAGHEQPTGGPAWLDAPPALARHRVWRAIGFLVGQQGGTSDEALARMRAHAFVDDVDLETAAVRILAGELPDS